MMINIGCLDEIQKFSYAIYFIASCNLFAADFICIQSLTFSSSGNKSYGINTGLVIRSNDRNGWLAFHVALAKRISNSLSFGGRLSVNISFNMTEGSFCCTSDR